MGFIKEKIQDNKSWNVIGPIKEFGLSIFQEFYMTHQDRMRQLMDDPEYFKIYKEGLKRKRSEALKTMSDFAKRYHEIFEDEELTDKCYSTILSMGRIRLLSMRKLVDRCATL